MNSLSFRHSVSHTVQKTKEDRDATTMSWDSASGGVFQLRTG
jgi:hypothetical protein